MQTKETQVWDLPLFRVQDKVQTFKITLSKDLSDILLQGKLYYLSSEQVLYRSNN